MPQKQISSTKHTKMSATSNNVYERWLASAPTISRKDAPEKWTVAWERFLQMPRPRGLDQYYLNAKVVPQTDEFLLSCYRGSYRDVCRVQLEVALTACNISSHTDFDMVWLGWTASRKRDFLQEAIVRGLGVRCRTRISGRTVARRPSAFSNPLSWTCLNTVHSTTSLKFRKRLSSTLSSS
ncbi:hypothetical protein C8R47DRAFT_111524 [Mycena vitilis]|nr:hypothetical protein C8R47DRAFT_111524 [Mycena vitilis]